MKRVGIFIDAGYMFAQGAASITRSSGKPRSQLELNEVKIIEELYKFTKEKTQSELLRIYWYDAISAYKGQTAEQSRLAHLDNVKLRYGFLNSYGQQKGVDSLIVTDLVDLARNQAISDAVLMSGDEDVRIGVQIAQSYGVRVHLLGISPSRGSQSKQLMQEADTTSEWDKDRVSTFLKIRQNGLEKTESVEAPAKTQKNDKSNVDTIKPFGKEELIGNYLNVVDEFITALTDRDVGSIQSFMQTGQRGIPLEYDSKLLAKARHKLNRDLTPDERKKMRQRFHARINSRLLKKE